MGERILLVGTIVLLIGLFITAVWAVHVVSQYDEVSRIAAQCIAMIKETVKWLLYGDSLLNYN